ncbi:MAG: DUF3810 domain-containing protein [Lachnospiraceae bacterium]|nr:DUF3810 domain-containing protein [Lachnospiraceae bacterium]
MKYFDAFLKKSKLIKVTIMDVMILTMALGLYILSKISVSFSDFYTEKIYNVWVSIIGRIMGVFPFSVTEILLYLLLLLTISYTMVVFVARAVRKRIYFCTLLTGITVIVLLYVLNCGINYGHTSYSKRAEMKMDNYETDELYELCVYLTRQVNYYAPIQKRDGKGVMYEKDIQIKAKETMIKIGKEDRLLYGFYPVPKKLINSKLLSVQQLAGIYSPFTIEANYNGDMPDFEQAFTTCHELSHLRGYMQEEEANYIAFISCINSDYDSFKYGGYLEGWLYATNELYVRDAEAYTKLTQSLCEEAVVDLEYNNSFWDRYTSKVAEISDKVNDTYLKANGQDNGVKSYDRIVGMMVEWYKGKAE